MKKVIIGIAAVALAFSASAAAVDWNTGNLSAFGVPKSDSGAYTANIYFYTLSGGDYTDVTSSFGAGTQVSDNSSSKSYAYNGTTASTMDSGTYYTKIVVTRASDGATLTSDMGSFTYNSSAQSNLALNFSGSAALSGGSNLWESASWAAVPEPTSGLLMLVGLGALALRRKRA